MATYTISNSPIHEQATITRVYGYRDPSYSLGYHTGVDFVKVGGGNPILYSTVTGTVIQTINSNTQALGTQVIIKDDNGLFWRYCHMQLNSIRVSTGQRVDTLTPVGVLGATGNVTGAHLHLELSRSASWSSSSGFVDPCIYLGIGDAVGNIINYNGEIPPIPPPPPVQISSINNWAKRNLFNRKRINII